MIETNAIHLFVFHCRDAIGQFCNDPSSSDTVNPASNHHNTFVHEMFQVPHTDRQNMYLTRHICPESLYLHEGLWTGGQKESDGRKAF